jgi:deazaflavin-dependent oxidoreductase (nitroreductase family)
VTNNRLVIRVLSFLQQLLYRLTGGLIGGRTLGVPTLLITTRGRKTGKSRTTPVLYLGVGEELVVVASNAGDDKSPGWWLNLQAEPSATVQVRRRRLRVRAREADAAERDRLWPELLQLYPTYERYQQRTERRLPVVILSPAPPQ